MIDSVTHLSAEQASADATGYATDNNSGYETGRTCWRSYNSTGFTGIQGCSDATTDAASSPENRTDLSG